MIDGKLKAAWARLQIPTELEATFMTLSMADSMQVIASAYIQAEARARMAADSVSRFYISPNKSLADYVAEVEAELSK